MTTVTKSAWPFALALLLVMTPDRASAQVDGERLRVSFNAAAAAASGDAELALGGSVGYRFLDRLWFEGEVTWIDAPGGGLRDRDLAFFTDGVGSAFPAGFRRRGGSNRPIPPGLIRASADGSTTIGTVGIRYELPVQTTRVRPYLAGGLGINVTEREFRFEPASALPAFEESATHTGHAFSAGAGASIRAFGELWIDADAKYVRLSQDRNIMRLGGGVSIRF